MSNAKNKVLIAKTQKARKIDALKFNADSNMTCALEYKFGEKCATVAMSTNPLDRERRRTAMLKKRGRNNAAIYANCRFLSA